MSPYDSLLTEPPTIAILLAKLQRSIDQERRENSLQRLGCQSDCQEHGFAVQLLTVIPQSATRELERR
jgi:hypothetical protein